MGKGRILANHGDGRYTIEIIEDRARAASARAIAASRVEYLSTAIAEKEQDLFGLQAVVDQAAIEQDQAIELYQQQIAEEGESSVDLAAHAQAVIAAAETRERVRGEIQQLKAERLGLNARIDLIDALPPLRQAEAWCADLTDDLEGEVATAEVPGEIGLVLVRPGYDGEDASSWPAPIQGGATWNASRDGAIQPALSGTPAGVFYNLAMMPGWQKWRPTFRIGTITSIDNDLCDITLDPATSSQQGLGVNMASAYDDVPIYYMDCNGLVFDEGDKVLVAFSGNTGTPMVVGFESEPRECCHLPLIDFNEHGPRLSGSGANSRAIGIKIKEEMCVKSIAIAGYTCIDITRQAQIILYRCTEENPNIPVEVLMWGHISVDTAAESYILDGLLLNTSVVNFDDNDFPLPRLYPGDNIMIFINRLGEQDDGQWGFRRLNAELSTNDNILGQYPPYDPEGGAYTARSLWVSTDDVSSGLIERGNPDPEHYLGYEFKESTSSSITGGVYWFKINYDEP